MKVLYILNSTNVYGGSTKSFMRYHALLEENYADVSSVICAPSRPPKNLVGPRTVFYQVPLLFHIYPPTRTLKDYLLFLPKLCWKKICNYQSYINILKIAQKEKVDIIHTNVGVINAGYKVAQKLHIPHIYHLREFQTIDFGMHIIPSFASFQRSLKQKGNYNICISKVIQEHFGLSESRTKVIYNGVKSCTYEPEKTEAKNYFLFVGRMEKAKGIFEVIEAFASFSAQNKSYELLIAGDTQNPLFKEKCRQKVIHSGIEDKVHFLGNRKDVDQLMQEATAIIVASSQEAFGLITAEAAFNHCLIIGKNTAGTKEQIENGAVITGTMAGLLYNNQQELVEMMVAVAEKRIDISAIITSAYQTAVKQYSIEQCVEQIYCFYSHILNLQGNE